MTFAKQSGQEPKKEESSSSKSRLPKSSMVSQEETKQFQPFARPRINFDITQIPTLAPESTSVLENPLQRRQGSPQIQAKLTIGQGEEKYEQEAESTQNTTNSPIQAKEAETANNTGLPDRLKTGIEHISGYSMDNVRVHYNSDKPATLQAHAYAQGTDIHIAPGQEKHLPHEAWHVVQQMQGRVKQKKEGRGGRFVNDEARLEKEADEMGEKAFGTGTELRKKKAIESMAKNSSASMIQKKDIEKNKLNVVGENHDESNERRDYEKQYINERKGIPKDKYFQEHQYKYKIKEVKNHLFGILSTTTESEHFGDPVILRIERRIVGLEETFKPWLESFQKGFIPSQLITEELLTLPQAWKSFYGSLHKEFKQIKLTMDQLSEETVGQKFEKRLNPIYKILESRLSSFEFHANCKDDFNVTCEADDTIRIIIQLVKNFQTQAKNGQELKSSDALDKQRSKDMHKAGQESGEQEGVWKVGQSHIEDINRESQDDTRNYNILTREEFNKSFEGWYQHKKDQKGGLIILREGEDEKKPIKGKKQAITTKSEENIEIVCD